MEQYRKILDELLGKDRDACGAEGAGQARVKHYYDADVCRAYVCGFCPYQMLMNTRVIRGTCERLHDDDARAEFLALPEGRRLSMPYEHEQFHLLKRLIAKSEEYAQSRVEAQEQAVSKSRELPPELARTVEELDMKIRELRGDADKAGTDGNAEECQRLYAQVDELQKRREDIMQAVARESGVGDALTLQMCEVCYLLVTVDKDDPRNDQHLTGKQHLAFVQFREWLDNFVERCRAYGVHPGKVPARPLPDSVALDQMVRCPDDAPRGKGGHRHSSGRDYDRHRDRDRDRDRDRYKDRDRDRDRRRSRSRSPRRDRHSRHERDERDRDYDRDRVRKYRF